MKKILTPTVMILLCTLFIAIMPTEAEGSIYGDTVRLHILANSDSKADQAVKLILRDAILEKYGKRLSVFEGVDRAKEDLSEFLPEIKSFSDKVLSDIGYPAECTVTLTEEWYDTREYESFTLPCGYYTSLRILIGEGAGQNWWCVMFPPLCLDVATSESKYTPEEEILISKKYNVKFKILELVSEIAR